MKTVADIIIERVGGFAVAAQLSGRSLATVYRWTWPVSRGGTGGVIPARAQMEMLRRAQDGGVDLTDRDFAEAALAVATQHDMAAEAAATQVAE